jgi:tripartite-type tricarboxylate transporter receptor subunit TctC
MNFAARPLHSLAAGTCALLGVVAAFPAAAQSVEQFYKGNTLTIMIGHPPGGSYDLYARITAAHIKKHIPGNPNTIVEHRPGGGGVRAVGFFYAQSPRDGSVIGLFPETITHTQIMQPAIGKWKMAEMTYLGSLSSVNAAFVRRKDAPAKSIEEMRKVSSNVGCTGKTSQAYQAAALLKNLGGFQFKIICGYPGSNDYVIALLRGEIDLVSSAWNQWRARHVTEIADGTLVPLIQTGLRRNKELANIPLMQEVVDDPEAKRIITFFSAGSAIGRAIVAPPKVPADRVAALRQAFDKMVRDPEFLRDAERIKAEVEPTPGAEVQKDMLEILNAPKEIVEKAARAIE